MSNPKMTPTDPTQPSSIESAVGKIMDKVDTMPAAGPPEVNEQVQRRSQALRDAAERVWADRGSRYEACRLANFRCSVPQQSKVREVLLTYANLIGDNIDKGTGIVLVGSPGTGKDHLLSALMTAAFKAGKICKWTSGPRLFATLRDDIDGYMSEGDRIREYTRPDVLVLSDPMPIRGELKDYQAAKLYEIVDARYNERRATWVSINAHDRAEADRRIGQAIMDRLIDGSLSLSCDWPSYRKAK